MDYHDFYHSPFGLLQIRFDQNGISELKWTTKEDKVCDKTCNGYKHFSQAAAWLDYFFGETDKKVDLPKLNLDNYTEFSKKVWKILSEKTTQGMSLSYSSLAELIGSPSAARAVGNAMKRNPLPLFIPCHRVVSKSGLGNYSGGGGVKTKNGLLELEARLKKRRNLEE